MHHHQTWVPQEMKGVQEYALEVTRLPLFKQQLTNQHITSMYCQFSMVYCHKAPVQASITVLSTSAQSSQVPAGLDWRRYKGLPSWQDSKVYVPSSPPFRREA
jgi:hypothetical protein